MRHFIQNSKQSLELLKKSSCMTFMLTSGSSRGRGKSTAASESQPEQIGKNLLSYRATHDSPLVQDPDRRPLVLLYGWLVAKSQHIHKYRDFYLQKGFDVLYIKLEPTEFMWPIRAQKVVSQVVDFTQQVQRAAQPVLVHGFSVGCYLYGETLVSVLQQTQSTENLRNRFRGHILDSPVDFDGVPFGVSKALTPVPLFQKLIQGSLTSYLALTQNYTMRHYRKAFGTFMENPFRTPTLFLYSEADKVCSARAIEAVMAEFKGRGLDVFGRCWPDSLHVSHFHSYPEEYVAMLNQFLRHVGLATTEAQDNNNTTTS